MFWMAKQWIDFLVCQRERNTYLWGLTKVHYFLFQKFYTWVTAKLIIKLVNFAISHKWSLCFSLWPINFQGKKWEGKIILKCILLWLEILFGRWLGMKQGQHWWKLAQMYCCVGNVLNSWLFSLTKLTIWLLHIAWAINFQYCTNQPYILSIAMLLFYYYGREFLVLLNVMCWMW